MTAPVVEPRPLSGDDATLDRLVNVEGIDQLTASQMLWAPELHEPAVPPFDAPRAEHLRWARWRAHEIVRQRMAAVIRWLGLETDYMALYRAGKGDA